MTSRLSPTHAAIAVAIAAFLLAFLIVPVLTVIYVAFTNSDGSLTLSHFYSFFQLTLMRESFYNSLYVGGMSVLLSSIISLPLAYFTMRFRFRGAVLVQTLGVLPLIMPPFVGAAAMQLLFGRSGSVNLLLNDWFGFGIPFMEGLNGVIFVEALHYFPFILLNLTVALANIDSAMEESAQNLGASGFRLFRRIVFPLAMPGYLAGAALVFLKVFDDVGTPLVLIDAKIAGKMQKAVAIVRTDGWLFLLDRATGKLKQATAAAAQMEYRFVRGGPAQGEFDAVSRIGAGEREGRSRQLSLKARLRATLDGKGTAATGSSTGFETSTNLTTDGAADLTLDLGFVPGSNGKNVAQMMGGGVDVLLLLGADELDTSAIGPNTFVVYQGHHGDAGAHRADVILPGAAYTEKSGTYANTEGRVQRGFMAVHPPGDAREDWTILRAFSQILGKTLPYDNIDALRSRMEQTNVVFSRVGYLPRFGCSDLSGPAGDPAALSAEPFVAAVTNYYQTDSISRSSPTMEACSQSAAPVLAQAAE